MGDLNLLTQLSTCFVLFCDWRIGTHQFSLHTLCFRFLLQLEVINISEYLTTQTPLPPFLPFTYEGVQFYELRMGNCFHFSGMVCRACD